MTVMTVQRTTTKLTNKLDLSDVVVLFINQCDKGAKSCRVLLFLNQTLGTQIKVLK